MKKWRIILPLSQDKNCLGTILFAILYASELSQLTKIILAGTILPLGDNFSGKVLLH